MAHERSEPTPAEEPTPVVEPVSFSPLPQVAPEKTIGDMGLLMDVTLTATVELGRCKLRVRDVLQLGSGSIIELDRLAGEPVDLLVNGRLVAKGEVVVIDEGFGFRVARIVTPEERAAFLHEG